MTWHLAALLALAPGDGPDFEAEVLPILSDHCFHCHGPDAGTRKAALRLDSHEGALEVLEPGSTEDSELHTRIVDPDPDWVMPPPSYGKPLSAGQVDILTRWIESGAEWTEHWAYRPIEGQAPGPHESPPREGAVIDGVVGQVLAEEGLAPSPPAAPSTWLRRVTLDLTGLPPTPGELDAFETAHGRAKDDGERHAARAAVVDDLLRRPARAEHRTRQWLDIARYADTNGYQNDFRRDQWPWRDWVLRAFADNMPYDRFVTLQVAGDLVDGADEETIIGTGFQRNHRTVTEAGSIDEEWRVENVADRAETTATAFMGLTLACARCHDHKYDQLSQADYYRFYAFFNSIDEKGFHEETRGNVPPLMEVPTAEQVKRRNALRAALVEGEGELERARAGAEARFDDWRASVDDPAEEPEAVLSHAEEAGEHRGLVPLDGTLEGARDLGKSVSFEGDRPFSVTCWVKPRSKGAIYSRMSDDDRYRGTDLVLLDGLHPAVHLIHSWPKNGIKVVGAAPLPRDRWSHLAVTYDGSGKAAGVRMLVNGTSADLRVEADSLDGTIATEEPLRLGTRRYAGHLDGDLLDVRVFGTQLDHGTILGLAARQAARWPTAELYAACFDEVLGRRRAELRALAVELETLVSKEIPTAMVLRERETPRVTRLLARGAYDAPEGEPLSPGIPALFGELESRRGAGAPLDRLDLARWLVSEENPLLARVVVNRVWAGFFGEGLCATPDDFGVRGHKPRHRALLDHLARGFIDSGWDLRALERRIALSATYGQSSAATPALRESDPPNRLLARGPRHRLDAEVLRDQALAVSGLLAERFGGRPVKPYQPPGLWAELAGGAGQGAYVPSTGDDLFRRSLYTYRKRTVPHPTLTTFDAPAFELCLARRPRTNTPLQALATLNDVTYVEAARHLARRMMAEGADVRSRLTAGFRLLLARSPSPDELAVLEPALERTMQDFKADEAAAQALLGVGATAPEVDARTPEWAAWTMVASTLLNLDEAVTKP